MPRSRDLVWDGCLNVRDLGGHRTKDGGETRYGAVVRADSIRQLTDAGWTSAVDYGVRTIVDLRTDEELEADPPAELPVDVLHVPFFQEDEEAFAEVEAASKAAPDYAAATRAVYLVFLERFSTNVAAAIRAVAQASEGGVVVHCMGGKDRTGLVTAFLLHIAGVDLEQIAADYALSEEKLQPRHAAWLEEAGTEAERERVRQVASTPPAAMVGVFEELERRHGSIEAYLSAAGLTEEDLRLARERLRG
ncbi:MAG: tyrosine-protein phosphatase [Gaiellaceae bacterium]